MSGCVSQGVEVPSWEGLNPSSEVVQAPLPLPEFPAITMSEDELRAVTAYLVASQGNYDIALHNAEALERQAAAYNYLIEAGKLQSQFSQIREEQLKEERKAHLFDNLFHRGLIVLGLAFAL